MRGWKGGPSTRDAGSRPEEFLRRRRREMFLGASYQGGKIKTYWNTNLTTLGCLTEVPFFRGGFPNGMGGGAGGRKKEDFMGLLNHGGREKGEI